MKARIKFASTCRVYLHATPSCSGYDLIMEYVEELRQEAFWAALQE